MDGRPRSDRQADDPSRTRVLPRSRSDGPAGGGASRNVTFRIAVRGYDRREVDRYVERANREIAELEITRSPESAVRNALDRVGEQTSAILQHARVSADEIVEAASAEAEQAIERAGAEAREIVAEAQAEADTIRVDASSEATELVAEGERDLASARKQADDVREQAERELRSLQASIDAIGAERRELVEEVRDLVARLEAVADFGDAANERRTGDDQEDRAGGEAGKKASAGSGPGEPGEPASDDGGAQPATGGAARARAAVGEPAGVEVWADQQTDA